MASKAYEVRSSVVRAAKKAGLKEGEFEVVQVWESEGKSHWEWKASARPAAPALEKATTPPVDTTPAARPVTPPTEPARKLVVVDYGDLPRTDDMVKAALLGFKSAQIARAVEQSEGDTVEERVKDALRLLREGLPPIAETKPASELPKPNKSTVEKPTKAVWAIADEMRKANPEATRKEIVDECIRRGIAFYTAKTQVQRFLKSKKTPRST